MSTQPHRYKFMHTFRSMSGANIYALGYAQVKQTPSALEHASDELQTDADFLVAGDVDLISM